MLLEEARGLSDFRTCALLRIADRSAVVGIGLFACPEFHHLLGLAPVTVQGDPFEAEFSGSVVQSKMLSVESWTGSTKHALSWPSFVPAFMGVGLFGRNSREESRSRKVSSHRCAFRASFQSSSACATRTSAQGRPPLCRKHTLLFAGVRILYTYLPNPIAGSVFCLAYFLP